MKLTGTEQLNFFKLQRTIYINFTANDKETVVLSLLVFDNKIH